jgi:phage head maturation protease
MTMYDDTQVNFGGEVKALDEDGDRLKIGGYAVLFGSPDDADLSPHRDYFTKATDFGFDVATRGRVRWHHGMDPKVGRAVLGLVDFKTDLDEVGVWAEGWIGQRTAYEQKVAEWVKSRKAGYSTGVAAHCVGRKSVGDAHEITEWPLGADVSITLTPADPRQVGGVLSLKSILDAPVAGPSLIERSERLVADLAEIVPLWEAAKSSRVHEGRDLSPEKRDALKALTDQLSRLAVAARPGPDPEELAATFAEMDALLREI